MSGGAQLSVTDLRRTSRHPVNLTVSGEHRQLGEIELHITNISTAGFMTGGQLELGRGERVTIRLEHIGRIEAFLVWNDGERAGFQFERILRVNDFARMIKAIQPSLRVRPLR